MAQTETSLDKLIEELAAFRDKFADEFIIYNLSEEAIPLLRPLLGRKMLEWRPFVDNASVDGPHALDYCKSTYASLMSLLDGSNSGGDQQQLNAYNRIVWETWMPALRAQLALVSLKQMGVECVDLLNEWSPVVPPWIINNVLEQIVLPKLVIEVTLII